MLKNIFSMSALDGYLTPGCIECKHWFCDIHTLGCGADFPIAECEHFAKREKEGINLADVPAYMFYIGYQADDGTIIKEYVLSLFVDGSYHTCKNAELIQSIANTYSENGGVFTEFVTEKDLLRIWRKDEYRKSFIREVKEKSASMFYKDQYLRPSFIGYVKYTDNPVNAKSQDYHLLLKF